MKKSELGLHIFRNVNGDLEPTMLVSLKPEPYQPEVWQGPAVLHVLQAEDLRATKRPVKMDKEGYLRTAEGGYYMRILKAANGGIVGYSTEASHNSVALQLKRYGPMLVAYDSLEKPKLLAVIQLAANIEAPKRPAPKADAPAASK